MGGLTRWMMQMVKNIEAFLILIRTGEGTLGDDGYRTLYGGGLFLGYSDHPRIAVKAGKYTSTAAGAYQILARTWDDLRSHGYDLPDFSPANQDKAAVFLIRRRKAYDDVIAGRFETAISKCNREWASLPGSPYGQPTMTIAKAVAVLHAAGATFEEVHDMPLPFVAAALPALLNAAPDLIRIFGGGEQSEKNAKAAEKVVEIAKVVTGEPTAEGAVAKIQADPAQAEAFAAEARAQFLDIERLSQERIEKARAFNAAEAPVIGRIKFVHILSLMVALAALLGIGYILVTSTDATERGMALQTLLVVGMGGVLGYWIGSSDGSAKKTELMGPKNG